MLKRNKFALSLTAAGTLGVGAILFIGASHAKADNVAKDESTTKKISSISEREIWDGLPKTVASINGEKISRKDFEVFLLSQIPGGKLPSNVSSAQLKMMAPQMVKGMVEQRLLELALQKASFTPSKDEIASELQKEFANMPSQQREAIEKQLTDAGSSMEKKIQEMLADKNISKQLVYKMFLDRNVFSSVKNVTEAEAKEFYDKNQDKFKHEKQFKVSHIL